MKSALTGLLGEGHIPSLGAQGYDKDPLGKEGTPLPVMPLPHHPFRGWRSLSSPSCSLSRDPLDADRDSHSWAFGDTGGGTRGHPTPRTDVGDRSLWQMGAPRDRQGLCNLMGSEEIRRIEECPQYQGQRVAPGLPLGQVGFPSYTWGPSVPDA